MRSELISAIAALSLWTVPIAVAQDSNAVSGAEVAEYILFSPMERLAEYCVSTFPETREELSGELDALRQRIRLAIEPYQSQIDMTASMSQEEFAAFKTESQEVGDLALSLVPTEGSAARCESLRKTLDAMTIEAIRTFVKARVAESAVDGSGEKLE